MMTFDEEQKVIEREFILTIKNDGAWHRATREDVDDGNYGSYSRICHSFTDSLLEKLGMTREQLAAEYKAKSQVTP